MLRPLNFSPIATIWSKRSAFVTDVATLAGGTALGQIIVACATPLLTRLYTAGDLGQVQVYLSTYAFIFVVVAWRYELAILLPPSDRVAGAVVLVALTVVAIMTVLTAAVAAALPWSDLVPEAFRFLYPYRWLWPVTLAGGGVYLVTAQWALRRGAYRQVTVTRITQTIGQVGTQLALAGRLHPNVWGLLLGDAVARVAGSCRLAGVIWREDRALFTSVDRHMFWSAARRYSRFPLISSFSAIVSTAGFAGPTLMLGHMFGIEVLGWYALVDRVMAVPSVLIGTAASQAYTAHAAKMAATDAKESQRFFLQLIATLALLGAVPFAILFWLGPTLFAMIFGEPWREAGVYASLLAIPHYVGFAAWPVMPILNVLERQGWQLGWDACRLVLSFGSLWLAARSGAGARVSIALYGAAILVSYAGHALLSYVALRRAPARLAKMQTLAASYTP